MNKYSLMLAASLLMVGSFAFAQEYPAPPATQEDQSVSPPNTPNDPPTAAPSDEIRIPADQFFLFRA